MRENRAFILDAGTIFYIPSLIPTSVGHALDMLFRDFEKVFGCKAKTTSELTDADVIVGYLGPENESKDIPEFFHIHFEENQKKRTVSMYITGSGDLGVIYGLLHFSHKYLGVDPFWFWTGKAPEKLDRKEILAEEFKSPKPVVRYRGWFVNDEVCLIGWTDNYPPKEDVWQPVFETLLRCGGNMVIPGTDLPRSGIHLDLASEMGLYVTHHHAEPLGAEMFFRIYPDKAASYDLNGALFEGLWREAIENQKDKRVIWILGFRGQGDCPFWNQDPSYTSPEKRGELISRVIKRQYEMLCEYVNDPPCSTYLYGEITELYSQGFIDIPEGVIKIWSDNGYGKMVSRRQENHNPRIPALPQKSDVGSHGLYYHVTFHDLQASNHLTMFPASPKLVVEEIIEAFNAGADQYLLLNCGNIRPHVYFLDIVKQLWNKGLIDIDEHVNKFCRRYFSTSWESIKVCCERFFDNTIQYGIHADDKAGDEFYHHPSRSLIGHLMRGETAETANDLIWATGNCTFIEQVRWFYQKVQPAIAEWEKYRALCMETVKNLRGNEKIFFMDFLIFQTDIHLSGCKGLISLCQSIFAFLEGKFPLAFIYASQGIWSYTEGLHAMKSAEHGKWENFFRADWLTNIKSTIYSLDALRKYIRMHGDNPDYFLWYKEFIMPENEKKIYLENTHRNPLSDDELAKKLIKKLI